METLALPALAVVIYIMFRFNRSIGKIENGLEQTVDFASKHMDFQLDQQDQKLDLKYGRLDRAMTKKGDKMSSRKQFRTKRKNLQKIIDSPETD